MGLRLKEGVPPEILKEYGFRTGKEWADSGERCLVGPGYEYQHGWWHKFSMDEEEPEKVAYTDDEYDIPMVKISFRTKEKFGNDLYIDCAPSSTYHIGGHDLTVLTDTLFDMISDGVLEKVEG